MMSSDAKYRDRLDKLADELRLAREAQRKMPLGAARERRARQLDALEQQQDAIRRTLGLPPCRERAEQVEAEELARAQAALADAERAESKRLRLAPARRLRRLMAWGGGRPRNSSARPAADANARWPGRVTMTHFILVWIAVTTIGMATYAALVSQPAWSPRFFVESAQAPHLPSYMD
jgi:multidrug efflux pump subunit AcrA (membrane-fusion protein)